MHEPADRLDKGETPRATANRVVQDLKIPHTAESDGLIMYKTIVQDWLEGFGEGLYTHSRGVILVYTQVKEEEDKCYVDLTAYIEESIFHRRVLTPDHDEESLVDYCKNFIKHLYGDDV